ncbi:MAG TPA: YkgJ family cysteine cluster protein [Candidatus Thermoplasmatota archaeon]|nr:YkgJ family cysteine cluster protein [Candidatus Thermoplasmatota archaeon]
MDVDRRELRGKAFACLDGCGFCCTFQPEVSSAEARALRTRVTPLKLLAHGDRSYLALQGGCGACSLLRDRSCTAYEARPLHCRTFPFHLYFGARVEAYVNWTCRGVESAPGSLDAAFEASIASVARERLATLVEESRASHAEFRRRARRAHAWGDAAAALAGIVARGGETFTSEGLEALAREGGVEATSADLMEEALEPFEERDVVRRPFYLAPDLAWLTGERDGDGLRILSMDEAGGLTPRGRVAGLDHAPDLEASAREGLARILAALAERDHFVGSAYHLVDEARYRLSVQEAVARRAAEVATDLVVRHRIVTALAPDRDAEDETRRFYDADFLDAPTIGGFL